MEPALQESQSLVQQPALTCRLIRRERTNSALSGKNDFSLGVALNDLKNVDSLLTPEWAPPRDHAREVACNGFSLFTASDYPTCSGHSPIHNNDFKNLQHSFDNLPVDPYMQDGGKYRRRRYGRFLADSRTLRTEPLENLAFFRSKEIYETKGGAPRLFESLEDGVADSKIFLSLISFHLENLPTSPLDSILIDDQSMFHNVTLTLVKSRIGIGTRDMILIDYNRCKERRDD